jgi:isoquinoline 1-oxidoreductase beta subunit
MAELASTPGKVIRTVGDVDLALAKGRRLDAEYRLPFLAHATMEPMNATVAIRGDSAEAWLPTQAPQWGRDVIAKIAGLEPNQVEVHSTLSGGGFGRRYQADFAAEAAQIAKAAGRPIQLVWTRDDDLRHDFYRPATIQRLSACLDDLGNPAAWHHRLVSTSIRAFWDPPERVRPERQEMAGAEPVYPVPNLRLEYGYPATAVPRAWWRSVAESMNVFVVESFIDELAAQAGVDPIEYRVRLLQRRAPEANPKEDSFDPARLIGTIRLAAERSRWSEPCAAGRARGIATAWSFGTYVTQIAEVSMTRGVPRVHRVSCVVDAGRIVHPDGAAAQAEGGIVYGLSAALFGRITIEQGAVKQSNFHDYRVLRLPEMPEVLVHFVPSEGAPSGMGEPCVPPIAPAVANALFRVTGQRLRELPLVHSA